MSNTWTFDPVKLLLTIAAIVAALAGYYAAGIICAALAGTSGFSFTWRR